jgi:hypothetical protein
MCISLSYAQNTEIENLYVGKWEPTHFERTSDAIKSIEITKMKTGFSFHLWQYDIRGESLNNRSCLGYIENGILILYDSDSKSMLFIDNKNQLLVHTVGDAHIGGTFKKSK